MRGHESREGARRTGLAPAHARIVIGSPPGEPSARLRRDVLRGLSRTPKMLPSMHLYDARGSELFRQIMELPEYYVTRVEREILRAYARRIVAPLLASGTGLDVIDLGAGDGLKTRVLLEHGCSAAARLRYLPIDVSETRARRRRSRVPPRSSRGSRRRAWSASTPRASRWLARRDPDAAAARADARLEHRQHDARRGRGASSAALRERAACRATTCWSASTWSRTPTLLQRAYDDASGVTAEFNLNLLRRINRELDARLRSVRVPAPRDVLAGAARDGELPAQPAPAERARRRPRASVRAVGAAAHRDLVQVPGRAR